MEKVLAIGGSGYLIPAVLFILVLYVIRGLFGLHGRRSQHRKEFLELWDATRSQDDLWLEVAVRHLCGAYLPARVIRLALAQPDRSQSLFDLAELWPLFRFDADSQTVSWQHQRHNTLAKRRMGRAVLLAGYFACALIAVLAALVASKSGDSTFAGWVYGVCAVVTGFVAIICLMREDTIKTAASIGDEWQSRINRHAKHSNRPSSTARHSEDAALEGAL
ncbi:hypothetical protein [Lysobacter tyrosinilyticus]